MSELLCAQARRAMAVMAVYGRISVFTVRLILNYGGRLTGVDIGVCSGEMGLIWFIC